MEDSTPVHFLNLEYFFRLLYETILGAGAGDVRFSGLVTLAAQIWMVVTFLAVIISFGALWVFITATIRLYQIRKDEHKQYSTITPAEADRQVDHSRWTHIQELMRSGQESDWRQAIIEADIMLEEVLVQEGYTGGTIGDMLKQANPQYFHTLQNAWDAHRVRNDIAHHGSAFQLTEHMAHRTIAHYEAVFREFNEI